MAAPNSKIDICNLALDELKQDSISSIDIPDTEVEAVMARTYDMVRRNVLRKGVWNFARKRTVLTTSADTPAFGFTQKYKLPIDYLRFMEIQDDNGLPIIFYGMPNSGMYYTIEDGYILINDNYINTDSNSLNFVYIYDQQNVLSFDSSFVQLFIYELALKVAYKLTGSNSSTERIAQLKKITEGEVRSINGQENPPRRIEKSRFTRARRNSGYDSRRFGVLLTGGS